MNLIKPASNELSGTSHSLRCLTFNDNNYNDNDDNDDCWEIVCVASMAARIISNLHAHSFIQYSNYECINCILTLL
ncbi:unnamed protein product [Ceratitis capitata]|uniref:(Mediterranean fruit fly) hypothetical protein n=1 Tax=Ceratitis capitata TaxID=7213 RepID=A0A811UXX7_CERCA|nr:unnamed protein product [Ceratitis capitata]